MRSIENKIIKTTLENWKELVPFQPKEFKKESKEGIKKLIQSFKANGKINAFAIWENKKKKYIIDGHSTQEVLFQLEKEGASIPEKFTCNWLDLKNEKEAKKAVLIYNSKYRNINSLSALEWISDLKIEELKLEINIPELDFKSEVSDDSFKIPKKIKTKIKTGDLIQIGSHRLLCGDNGDEKNYEILMQGKSADMVFTDPPYGVSIGSKNKFLNKFRPSKVNETEIKDDTKSPEKLYEILLKSFSNLLKYLSDSCAVFVCAPQGGGLGMMMMMMMKDAGLEVKHVLIWKKNRATFSLGRLDYEYQHEPILFTWTKKHKFYGEGKFKTSVWEVDKPMRSKEHPTMKPVELVVNAILNHTLKNEIVIDPYMGSGTSMVAAHQTNRVCYGMEISPEYCQVIVDRMKSLDPKIKIRISHP